MTTNDRDGHRIQIINTPSGRMALVRPIAERLLAEGVIHGTLDGVLHATDGATVKAATMADGVCDFCSAPGIEHGFDVPDFDLPEGAGRAVDGWAACGPCGELIKAENKKALMDRCMKALAFSKFTRHAIEELHARFWKSMDLMVYAKTLSSLLADVADDKVADKLPDPAWTNLREHAARMEMLSHITHIPIEELHQAFTETETLSSHTAVKLLDWSAHLIGKHGKDEKSGKLSPSIINALMGTSRPPLPRIVPHWQDAFDAKSQVLTMLAGLMKKNRAVAEYFDEGIDLNDTEAVKRMVQLAEYRQNLDRLSVGDDYRALRPAQIYSFNAETEAAIMQAADSIPHDSPLSSIETPNTGSGWFWFGEPLSLAASPVASERTHALLWSWVANAPGTTEPALMFSVYVKDEKGISAEGLPTLFPSSRWHWPLSQTFHEMLAANIAGWRTVYGPGGQLANSLMRLDEERVTKVIAGLSLFFVMACVWFRQTVPGQVKKINPVLTTAPGQIERHARKRFQREHKLDAQVIHVVALRKTARTSVEHAPAEHAEGARQWGCRWIVAGHARLQACGPGRKDRKLIWIESFVKGPDDKPLKTKATTVYAVVR